MRVLVAPDSFGGTLTAVEAAAAIADGWRSVAPYDDLDLLPLSDGGPGFVDVLAASLDGRLVSVEVADPLRRPVPARFLVAGDTAYVESAQACGLHLLAPAERDPSRTTTYGVGQLIQAAIETDGVRRVVVGLGGSATNDGGRGAWEVLGDAPLPAGVELVAATDVGNPLLGPNGASAVYGPQKGADRAMVLDLDDRLRAWADDVEGRLGLPGLRDRPGAGAAGGLGFALFAWGAARVPGFDIVAAAVGLADRVEAADLAVTGEGSFDAQSLRGKVPAGVAAAAQDAGVPCVVVAGRVEVGRRDAAAAGVEASYAVTEALGVSPDAAVAAGAGGIRAAAAQVARAWAR
ncbi:MAG: glycerate kinase [Frankiaceae bacterium]|nr:glycerate kinase [Frankiaceae bacterium]MBV9369036.1 glycerate kinase [Frankiales bacterium]